MASKDFGVAILGFGTVGSGVYELLHGAALPIEAKYAVRFHVHKILVRRPGAIRAKPVPPGLLAKGISEILADPRVDVIIEVMGGESPAREHILESLKAGKHVITANKKLLGACGDTIAEQARAAGRFLGFSGAITGCHQLCPSIARSVMIRSLMGIFNGTSNYILTQMEAGQSFAGALAEAQRRGYAEADPTEDVDGIDSRNKLAIMTKLAFGKLLDPREIPTTGIRQLSATDMTFARELGFSIKLLAVSRMLEGNRLYASVRASLVPLEDPLAGVQGAHNGIQIYDALRGAQAMLAPGAGSQPTAMAVFHDLISLARGEPNLWPPPTTRDRAEPIHLVKVPSPGEYYVRMNAKNRPGVLAAITRIFAQGQINLANVLQKGAAGAATIPVVLLSGPVEEAAINTAVKKIEATGDVDSCVLARVERLQERN